MKLINGECLEVMKRATPNSIDAIVTDPPYGLKFMGKKWDYDVPSKEIWIEALRVLKPGGYLLSFGGSRTYHRMAVAIEDAGFEIRDQIMWVYGSGFPKSLNIGKAVDKLQGNEREDLGHNPSSRVNKPDVDVYEAGIRGKSSNITKGTSDWEGWGTALKPAHEPIVVARKPLSEKTVALNCLKWGVGGINIDASRVGTTSQDKYDLEQREISKGSGQLTNINFTGRDQDLKHGVQELGRFPANLIHDGSDEVVGLFPNTKSGKPGIRTSDGFNANSYGKGMGIKEGQENGEYGDSGSAARFFYCAKASKRERNAGLEGMEKKEGAKQFNEGMEGKLRSDGTVIKESIKHQNNHPTVKPIALMEYLIKLVSREGARILDPFMGSGTTGIAAKNLNRDFIGIELDAEYFKIAENRIKNTPE